MRVALATLGCKVNHYETEAMRELFLAAGWTAVPFPEMAEVYVINTCTVTGVSDQKSRQMIAKAHRANPAALIAVAGCYAEVSADEVQKLPGVGLILGTEGRTQIVARVTAALEARRAHAPAGPQAMPGSVGSSSAEAQESVTPAGPQAMPGSVGSSSAEGQGNHAPAGSQAMPGSVGSSSAEVQENDAPVGPQAMPLSVGFPSAEVQENDAPAGQQAMPLSVGSSSAEVQESVAPAGLQAMPLSFGSFLSGKKRTVFEPLSAVRDGRTRATLKIQDGCVNFCSYCIIPYARGPLRSRPLQDVETQLRLLAEEGYAEVVFTGIHLASYGRDLGDGTTLVDVLALTKGVDGIRRVRLGSLEPGFADARVAEALAGNEKICRQFHLSLQSGSGAVLKRMNRKYTPEEYAAAVARLRGAMQDCAITTDVIAGFCGETEQEHRETLAFCQQMGFARMHVFPFSLRKGTKAASMPGQLVKAVKEARARELIALGKRLTNRFLTDQIGTVQEVLVERDGMGYTGNYVHVQTNGGPGAILRVRITGIENEIATGKELDNE